MTPQRYEELRGGVMGGDADAWREFARAVSATLRRYLVYMAPPGCADDMAQEVVLRLVRHAEVYELPFGLIERWLRVTARHLIIDHHRAAGRERRALGRVEQPTPPLPPPDALLAGETVRTVHRAIGRLSKEYREVIVLAELDGVGITEIAQELGESVAAVRSRLFRARVELREMLGND